MESKLRLKNMKFVNIAVVPQKADWKYISYENHEGRTAYISLVISRGWFDYYVTNRYNKFGDLRYLEIRDIFSPPSFTIEFRVLGRFVLYHHDNIPYYDSVCKLPKVKLDRSYLTEDMKGDLFNADEDEPILTDISLFSGVSLLKFNRRLIGNH